MEGNRLKRKRRIEIEETDANGQVVGIVICDEDTARKKGLIKKVERMNKNERNEIKR